MEQAIRIEYKEQANGTQALLYVRDVEAGYANIMTDDGMPYVEYVDVYTQYKHATYLQRFLKGIAQDMDEIAIAPDTEEEARLYDGIGQKLPKSDYDAWGYAVDQGHGVYTIRKSVA